MTPRRLICELVVKFDNSIFIVRSLIVTGQYKRITIVSPCSQEVYSLEMMIFIFVHYRKKSST